MKKFFTIVFFFLSLSMFANVLPADIYKNLPFEMNPLKEIKFRDYQVNVLEYGAVPDGETNVAPMINKAIDEVHQSGGGKVIIPQGLWLSGPIVLKSNVCLHLERGALLVFSTDKSLYPLRFTSFEGLNTRRCQSPISAEGATNIGITGQGIIDGKGDVWRPLKKNKLTNKQWKKLVKSGGVVSEDGKIWYPSSAYAEASKRVVDQNIPNFTDEKEWEKFRDFLRPVMLSFIKCDGVLLQGPTFQNSPAWCIHPLMCTNFQMIDCVVRNPWYGSNGDGLDLESCKGAVVYRCSFDVGDDAICIKSGKDEDGRRRAMPCEQAIIRECTVYHGHGGFVVGSEMSGGVKDMLVKDCTFIGTDVGLRFKSKKGRGGVVERITIDGIRMMDIEGEPILFNLYYQGKSALAATAGGNATDNLLSEENQFLPEFKDISISNVFCRGGRKGIYINGLPEKPIHHISLKNIKIFSSFPAEYHYVENLTTENVEVIVEK